MGFYNMRPRVPAVSTLSTDGARCTYMCDVHCTEESQGQMVMLPTYAETAIEGQKVWPKYRVQK
jgi:hypothetical protein